MPIVTNGTNKFEKRGKKLMAKNILNSVNNNIDCESSIKSATTTVHFWWTLSLMVIIIIILLSLLLTNRLNCDSRIMTFLSFTSTLLSIVLSVFAVMYSFFSMQDASRQWKNVDKAVKVIEAYTNIINGNNQQLLEQVISINRNIGSIQGTSNVNNEIPSGSIDDIGAQSLNNNVVIIKP